MKLVFMRHGNAEHNLHLKINESNKQPSNLTKRGRQEVLTSAIELQNQGIRFNIIYCSPLIRCRQTAEIVNKQLNMNIPIKYDKRLSELKTGFDNHHLFIWSIRLMFTKNKFNKKFKDGQSIDDVLDNMRDFYAEIEQKHSNENVLIISHLFQFQLLCHHLYGTKIKMPWAQHMHLNTSSYHNFKLQNQSSR